MGWYKVKFGDRIKTLRETEGLTQNALAQKADIYQSHLRRVELGQAGIQHILRCIKSQN